MYAFSKRHKNNQTYRQMMELNDHTVELTQNITAQIVMSASIWPLVNRTTTTTRAWPHLKLNNILKITPFGILDYLFFSSVLKVYVQRTYILVTNYNSRNLSSVRISLVLYAFKPIKRYFILFFTSRLVEGSVPTTYIIIFYIHYITSLSRAQVVTFLYSTKLSEYSKVTFYILYAFILFFLLLNNSHSHDLGTLLLLGVI